MRTLARIPRPRTIRRTIRKAPTPATIPHPPSIRDFSCFEDHYRAGLKAIGRQFDARWYESPTFYFSNNHVVVGPETYVYFPRELQLLFLHTGFEIEATYGGYRDERLGSRSSAIVMVGRRPG